MHLSICGKEIENGYLSSDKWLEANKWNMEERERERADEFKRKMLLASH